MEGSEKRPTVEQLERELKIEQDKHNRRVILRNTVFFLSVVAAAVVLVVVFLFPVVQIDGTSMTPNLQTGDVTITVSRGEYMPGDVIAFYHNNSVVIKRVVAIGGDQIDIDEDGAVYRNGQLLEEPYLEEKARGSCDVKFPYEVPAGQYFVLGDHRSASIDSRHAAVGCVSNEMILGRVVLRIWPLNRLGRILGSEQEFSKMGTA